MMQRICVRMLFAASVGGLFVVVASASGFPTPRSGSPNFIVILCDNLGYGDIEPFGSTLHRTPALSRMAREGARFTHFYVTAGVCTPSRASLMTGCYAQRIGMHTNRRDGHVLRPISPYGLNPEEITVAEILKSVGYATCLIGKWHLGDQPEFLPCRQGFDEFLGVPYSDDMTRSAGRRLGRRLGGADWPPLPLVANDTVIEAPCDRATLTGRYTERSVDFIERHKSRPFFLLLSHAMPGSTSKPFAGEAFRGKSRNGPWGDAVEEIDWSTGRILDKLVELEIHTNTLVVWTSDNGASMSADLHGSSRGTNRPLFGRGYTTAEGAFRVPMIAWWPGRVPPHSRCEQMATTMDLLPTLARLAGASIPTDRVIDGHDIRPLLFGKLEAATPYTEFFYYYTDQLQAVRSGKWKLFVPVQGALRHPHFGKGRTPRTLLFDVVNDVGSTADVAEQHPDVVARLMQLAEQAREELGDRDRSGDGLRPCGQVENPQPMRMMRKQGD